MRQSSQVAALLVGRKLVSADIETGDLSRLALNLRSRFLRVRLLLAGSFGRLRLGRGAADGLARAAEPLLVPDFNNVVRDGRVTALLVPGCVAPVAEDDLIRIGAAASSKKRGRAQSAAAADDESGAAPARPTKRSRTISAPAKPTITNTTTTKVKAAAPSRKTSAPTHRSASAKSSGAASSSTSRMRSASAEPDLSRVSSPEESELETDEDEFDEIEDHRLYPRPGNGFSTSSDPAELNILAEDPESQTFSHRLHGPAKQTKQAKITKKAF